MTTSARKAWASWPWLQGHFLGPHRGRPSKEAPQNFPEVALSGFLHVATSPSFPTDSFQRPPQSSRRLYEVCCFQDVCRHLLSTETSRELLYRLLFSFVPVIKPAPLRFGTPWARDQGYVIGRTHINSCDFSVSSYSFDDVPGDVGLKACPGFALNQLLHRYLLSKTSGSPQNKCC